MKSNSIFISAFLVFIVFTAFFFTMTDSPSPTILIFGTFDQFHAGHRYVIEEAMALGNLTVVVAQDENVKRMKGFYPEQNEDERVRFLRKKYPDAQLALGHESDFFDPIRRIQPDLIVLGYDQAMPPGIHEEDLPCTVKRLDAFEPEKWKSSYFRNHEDKN
jgi:FAD synthetase